MRQDKNIKAVLEIDDERENNTGCCVYNDGSGCVQAKESDCSVRFNPINELKWLMKTFLNNLTS